MTIFEIAIATQLSAAQGRGGAGCVVYGMFDADMAPDYDLEFVAHLPIPAAALGTLALCLEALEALGDDVRQGDHIDIALPTSVAAMTVDALASAESAELLGELTGAITELRRSGISVRVTRHDRANRDSVARAAALADLATDETAFAAFEARRH